MSTFERILAMDCETSGLFMRSRTPSHRINESGQEERYQAVSWGMIVLDLDFNELDRLYVEIAWDGNSLWSSRAEAVHKLSKEYLEKNALSFEEAYTQIGGFIFKWFGGTPIVTLGHNNITFDLDFLRNDFKQLGIDIPFGNRHLDSNTLGFTLFKTHTSDELFRVIGQNDRTDGHNAMDDIERTVRVFQVARALMTTP